MQLIMPSALKLLVMLWYCGLVRKGVVDARCRRSIFNHNGVEILLGNSLYDQVVVLYLMKRRCGRRCWDQLIGLNKMAEHFM